MSTIAYEEPEWLADLGIEDPLLPWDEVSASVLPPRGEDPDAVQAVECWLLRCAETAKDYELQEEALDRHIKELATKKKRKEIAAKRLRGLIRREMLARKWTKVKTALCTLSLSKAGTALAVVAEANVPEEFIKVEKTVRLADAQKHFKETGEIPDGFDVVDTDAKLSMRWS